MNNQWLEKLLSDPDMLEMGHGQTAEDLNLGLGWIYYSLARVYRPRRVVCIGSWRGFVPMLIARGMQDNLTPGSVTFIDPGLVDDHWQDADQVRVWFADHAVPNIQHYRMTTQQFVTTAVYQDLDNIDMLFVDGLHIQQQARFDHASFEHKMSPRSIALFHDSMTRFHSPIYGADRKYEFSVCDYITELKQRPDLQVMDLPFENGLTLVRQLKPES